MYQQGRLEEVCKAMDDAKVDVLGLSEVRWNQSGEVPTNDGKKLIYPGMPEVNDDHIYGVGILLSRQTHTPLFTPFTITALTAIKHEKSFVNKNQISHKHIDFQPHWHVNLRVLSL